MKRIHRDIIKSEIQYIKRELEILIGIDHPNIIKFEELYIDSEHFYFVT
jgi:serine/threonine protein kinase